MQSLEKIGEKRKLLTDKQHKLLDKAMSSAASAAQNKSKAKVTQSAKSQKIIRLDFLVVENVFVGFYCKTYIHLVTVNFDIVYKKSLAAYLSHSFKQLLTLIKGNL